MSILEPEDFSDPLKEDSGSDEPTNDIACPTCGDSQEVECPDCEGNGTIAQSIDDDIGVTCETCNGSMSVPCPECKDS